MLDLTITASDLTDSVYSGHVDLSRFAGNVYIDRDLGIVRFPDTVDVRGFIYASRGSGLLFVKGVKARSVASSMSIDSWLDIITINSINAISSVRATRDIKSARGIISNTSIKSGRHLRATSIRSFGPIECGGTMRCSVVESGLHIDVGESVVAKNSIRSGTSLTAGNSIKCDGFVVAMRGISCDGILRCGLVAAGVSCRDDFEGEDHIIKCGELTEGTVIHGTLFQDEVLSA